MRIDIGECFSPYPFGRYSTDGPYNGERFREEILKPAYEDVKNEPSEKLTISFEHVKWAVGSSFLSESFEEFVKLERIDPAVFLSKLEIEEPDSTKGFYQNTIKKYILDQSRDSHAK